MRDFAGVISQAEAPCIVESRVGEWSEGSNRDLGLGEVCVDGLKVLSEVILVYEGSR